MTDIPEAGHYSDCAVHNEPLSPNGPCDCGGFILADGGYDTSVTMRSDRPGALGDFLRDMSEEQPALVPDEARWASERRMIVAHSTGGGTDGVGMSTNDVCVAITAFRNKVYEAGSATRPEAIPAEAVRALVEAGERQADNMAFVLNHATLPAQWADKFAAELEADRATIKGYKL